MKKFILITLLIFTNFVDASDRISKQDAIVAAKKVLKPEVQKKFNRITLVEWKEHVRCWMIAFEYFDKNIEDGVWVMIDEKGEFFDMGKVYADH